LPTGRLTPHPHVHDWYSHHHGWLHGWLSKRLGCTQRAADVAHNTFLRMLLAREPWAGVAQPRAWLTVTAKRLIIDDARRERLEQAYLAELAAAAADGAAGAWPSPELVLEAVQALAQLDAVLRAVSAKARAAFVGHYLEGRTQADVAASLGLGTRVVQHHLAQVLLKCAEQGVAP
jgi:RNA polymerase sigma factor (sigma-70 family)